MRRYGGTVVFRTDGPHGPLEVVDDELIRSLHFGDATRQSSMLLAHPAVLVLPYTQYMLLPLLFEPRPARLLFLGLGGASLPRFYAHHFPEAAMDVVELREDVIETARRWFELPEGDGITIHHEDCARFAADAGPAHTAYDTVFLDIYDRRGIVPLVEETAFLERVAARMSPAGILVANLSQVQRQLLRRSLRAMRRVFGGGVMRVPVTDKGNEVALASPARALEREAAGLARRAAELKARFGIDFPDFLARLTPYEATSLLQRLTRRR